ncbi:MAG: oligosaccharide repeat unit polymerase [Selenomonadaceae bacterium]|nr:oligosaccharide repeat unit polymerase [Selenomonadaceae bacterium]
MVDFFVPLSATLFVILLATVLYFRFDFMQPSIIFVGTLMLSVAMAMTLADKWCLTVGLKTFLCLALASTAFVLGNIFADRCVRSDEPISNPTVEIRIGNLKIILALLIMAVLLYFNFLESYEMSIELGNKKGLAEMIRVNRQAIEAQLATFSRWTSYRSMLAQAITYTFLYVFVRNAIERRVIRLRYLLPLLLYIPMLILNTGRMGLLCLFVYVVVVASIIHQRRHPRSIVKRLSTVKALVGAAIGFAALFMLMGVFTGKTITAERTPLIILAHYAGLSIPALDVFLNRDLVESTLIGSHTLHGIYRTLGTIGFDLPTVPLFLPFVAFNGIDTNVYTAEARYIQDYGWLGMTMILWSFGALYSFGYRYVRDRSSALPLMFYGFCSYPLFLSSIDERVMLDLFSTTPIYILILLWLCDKIFPTAGSR